MNIKSLTAKSALFTVALLIGINFTSCSDDDDDNNHNEKENAAIQLTASKTTIIPFESIQISIDTDSSSLYNTYDSVLWTANGLSELVYDGQWEPILKKISITDYQLGIHKVYACGFKNGLITSMDSVAYTVNKPDGDFLNIRWGTCSKNQNFSFVTGKTPKQYIPTPENKIAIGGAYLGLNHIADTNKEYARLGIHPWYSSFAEHSFSTNSVPNINDFDWTDDNWNNSIARFDTEYALYHSYLTELYGTSQFIYNGDDLTQTTLWDEYTKQFTHYEITSNYYPVEIWKTSTSAICIIRYNNKISQRKVESIVIAEPLKK